MTTRQESAAPLPLEAPVRRVVLLEDRAQVVRSGIVELATGSHRLRISGVTPLAADRTLTARLPEKVRLDETRMCRRWRIGTAEQPPDAAAVEAEVIRLKSLLDDQRDSMQALSQQRALLDQAVCLYVDNVNQVLPYASDYQARWETELEALQQQRRQLDQGWHQQEQQRDDIKRQLAAAELKRRVDHRPDHVLEADCEISVTASEPGRCAIEVEYTVPCALWRPIHRATLRHGKVAFECEAAVWQATGEDWSDVDLKFSTARPTQRSEPPTLVDDLVRVRRKQEKKVSVRVREEKIATTGEGAAADEGLPGVDDGGETRLLDAAVRTTVVADGQMRRVAISAFEVDGEIDRVCCSELAPLVHLRSRQVNAGRHPILAGPVDIVRESGYVGRSEIGFVAVGERFALGWGSEDGLRVRRERREKRDTTMLTGKQVITRTVELFLSNLDDQPAAFELQERIPVSEIDKVKVALEAKECAPAAAADDQGILRWPIKLPPLGTQQVKLVFTITASSDVQGL
ncbi:MAG: DUF4139 domain-containing protein [Deltaproteobacteria bacterium]|nr:DUF4139 domain-containing protein [Deltaproteobacteria bacterium]